MYLAKDLYKAISYGDQDTLMPLEKAVVNASAEWMVSLMCSKAVEPKLEQVQRDTTRRIKKKRHLF